jgi:NAD(P)-dependent dehydrogenase (short-subunit alcohol dehydrogenase family)
MNRIVVITGANRGIGLAFCRYYQAQGDRVYAVCRQNSKALASLGVNVIEGIDVIVASDIQKLQNALSNITIDVLINNAGILRDERLGELDFESIQLQFEVNALGPLRVTEALKDKLSSGSKIAMITSRMGSITDNTSGGRYGYRMSKAALNIASMSVARDLESKGIALAILHPGLVGTEMIGGHGDLTPEQAAARLACRIEALNLSNTGTFWHSNGETLPW